MDEREPPPGPAPAAGFSELDYSGDVGLEVWGRSFPELVANATRGLLGLMCWTPVAPAVSRPVAVRGVVGGDLLVDWLSAVIQLAGAHGEVYGEVVVESVDAFGVAGVVRGEAVDPQRHELRFDVKAATYHGLRCEQAGAGWYARVILDL